MGSNACAIQVDDGPIIGSIGSTSRPPALSVSFEHIESNPTLSLRIECSRKVPGSEEWSEFSWSVYDICEGTWTMDKLSINVVSEQIGSPKTSPPAVLEGLGLSWKSHLLCISLITGRGVREAIFHSSCLCSRAMASKDRWRICVMRVEIDIRSESGSSSPRDRRSIGD